MCYTKDVQEGQKGMVSTMKKVICVMMVLELLIAGAAMCAKAETINPNYGEFYPRLSIVVDVIDNVVVCEDRDGNIWEFFTDEEDADGWAVGDLCNLLMWNTSENIEEHEVVEVYWEGYIEPELIDSFWIR